MTKNIFIKKKNKVNKDFRRKFSLRFTIHYLPIANRGFTLVETLVAITILLLAIVGPMSLAKQSIASSRNVKNQMIAYYLAQESFEFIRSKRDSNILDSQILLNGLADCLGSKCTIDTINNNVNPCGSNCELIRKSPIGLYGYTSSWTETGFRRRTEITASGTNSDEISIDVTVFWDNDTRSFHAKESLFDTR